MAEQRTKEIGIRKGLGASATTIIYLITREFTKWVIIAFVFACPLAYLIMFRWLQNFAYHTNISWWIFVLAGILSFIIAIFTVGYQAIKASQNNPANSLQYE